MKLRVLAALSCLAVQAALFPVSAARSRPESQAPTGSLDQDPAIAALREKIAAAPNDACLKNELGIALGRRSFFEEAEGAFQESLAITPDPIVYNNLGSLYLATGKLSRAASAFRTAIELDHNFALAWYNLGAAYDAGRKDRQAEQSYKRALELDPSLGDPAHNPQVVNNHYLLTVRTQRYLDTVGGLGLPLRSSCGSPAEVKGTNPPPPAAQDPPAKKKKG